MAIPQFRIRKMNDPQLMEIVKKRADYSSDDLELVRLEMERRGLAAPALTKKRLTPSRPIAPFFGQPEKASDKMPDSEKPHFVDNYSARVLLRFTWCFVFSAFMFFFSLCFWGVARFLLSANTNPGEVMKYFSEEVYIVLGCTPVIIIMLVPIVRYFLQVRGKWAIILFLFWFLVGLTAPVWEGLTR